MLSEDSGGGNRAACREQLSHSFTFLRSEDSVEHKCFDGCEEVPTVADQRENTSSNSSRGGDSNAEYVTEGEADDGHCHGNFKHYYDFHNASAERFQGIEPGSFAKIWGCMLEPDTFLILDIGCNEGNLTAELLHLVRAELPPSVRCVAYGLDFDGGLIEVARRRHEHNPDLLFFVVDVMVGDSLGDFMRAHGLAGRLALAACLRVSMWVHLNHGDAGLERLLQQLGGVASRAVLLDPQKLSYYKKACSRNAKLGKAHFPFSLEELSLTNDLPAQCLTVLREHFGLGVLLHRDISLWGGTLLFLMREEAQEEGERECDCEREGESGTQ